MLEFNELDILDPEILGVEPNGLSKVFNYSVLQNNVPNVQIYPSFSFISTLKFL